MNNSTPAIRAFSLVEVVLALGIVTFALVALLGLFAVGINSSRQSSTDTSLGTMSLQAMSYVRGLPFPGPSFSTNLYFTSEATLTNDPASSLYACALSTTNFNPAESADISTNLVKIIMKFTSPVYLPAASRPNTNIFYGTLANR